MRYILTELPMLAVLSTPAAAGTNTEVALPRAAIALDSGAAARSGGASSHEMLRAAARRAVSSHATQLGIDAQCHLEPSVVQIGKVHRSSRCTRSGWRTHVLEFNRNLAGRNARLRWRAAAGPRYEPLPIHWGPVFRPRHRSRFVAQRDLRFCSLQLNRDSIDAQQSPLPFLPVSRGRNDSFDPAGEPCKPTIS
jgi:hypothetical protein